VSAWVISTNEELMIGIQVVQKVQIVRTPSFIFPPRRGEDRGKGLSGAQRLNGFNFWNGWNDWNAWRK
jgi:hypothetical protein